MCCRARSHLLPRLAFQYTPYAGAGEEEGGGVGRQHSKHQQ
jgi:hypothetical protein